jgi:hypothetical protein
VSFTQQLKVRASLPFNPLQNHRVFRSDGTVHVIQSHSIWVASFDGPRLESLTTKHRGAVPRLCQPHNQYRTIHHVTFTVGETLAIYLRTHTSAMIALTLYPLRGSRAYQIFLRDAYVLPKLLSYKEYADVTGGKPIAV